MVLFFCCCSETARAVCRGSVGFKMNLMELYALLLMSEDKIRQEVLWTRCFTSCLCSWNPRPVLLPAPCFLSRATSLKCRHWFCTQVSIIPPFVLHDRFCPRSPNHVHAKVSTFVTYSSLNYISILIFYHVYFCLHNFKNFTHFCTYFCAQLATFFFFFPSCICCIFKQFNTCFTDIVLLYIYRVRWLR